MQNYPLRHFQPLQLGVVGLMAVVGLVYVTQPTGQPFVTLQALNLAPNLLGHLIFSFFGGFAGYLGGPVTQVAFPLSLALYLFSSSKLFFSSLALFWAAQNLFEVALYARDARSRSYMLIGGPDHVWHSLLSRLGLLELDQFVGALIYLGGVFTLLAALMMGLTAAKKSAK